MTDQDLMITNGEKNLAIAGVFGGKESGVSEDTTTIFIEAAYFNPVSVRKTAKRHGLNTDASFRYRSEEHTSELQSRPHLVCRLLLEKKKNKHLAIING